MNDFKILVKFPTRERPEWFFETLDLYIQRANNINDIIFLITCDRDDTSMNNSTIIDRLESYKAICSLYYFFGESKTKVQAINADINKVDVELWNVLVVASEDLEPVIDYDSIIHNDFKNKIPDTDGVLWYYDGFQNQTNTLVVMGKKYYLRFNYINHPSYCSLWGDNELTEVSKILNKSQKIDSIVLKHKHPAWGLGIYDNLYIRNESFIDIDKENFYKRKELNFNL